MVELEKNMATISTASEVVDSSLSARRGQLEKLNGAKKNLTKLQFLMDLPARSRFAGHLGFARQADLPENRGFDAFLGR